MKFIKYLQFIVPIVFVLALPIFIGVVHANPSSFPKGVSSATATSTLNYFAVAATATTTLAYDAYQLAGTQPSSNAADSATVVIQFTATTTTSALNWRYEYADDQPGVDCTVTQTACDWYSDAQYAITNASTTVTINPVVYSWTYASSTDLCSSTQIFSSNNRGCRLVKVPTPTRYVRVVAYRAPGASNGAVWMRFIPVRENKN